MAENHFSRQSDRSTEDYLRTIDPEILQSFSPEQIGAVSTLIDSMKPKNSPKIIDLRFTVDLIFSRYFFVLFVGKDRRKKAREYPSSSISRVGNILAVFLIILSLNLLISMSLLVGGYLVKSFLGINLFPDHFGKVIQKKLK